MVKPTQIVPKIPLLLGAIALLTNCATVPNAPGTETLSEAWPDASPSAAQQSNANSRSPTGPIQVYFNYNPDAEFTDPYRHIQRPGDDFEQILADAINQATRTVDVAVQELRLPRVAQALIDRHRAGVQVRVIVEDSYRRPWSAYSKAELDKLEPRERGRIKNYWRLGDRNNDKTVSPEERDQTDTMHMLAKAQIPVIDDRADGSKGSGLMHHKFIIVDGQQVLTGSANFTPSDTFGDPGRPQTRGNPNHLVAIDSTTVAAWFQQEFNTLWGDGPGGNPDSRFGITKDFQPARTTRLGNTQLTVHFAPAAQTIDRAETTTGTLANALAQVQTQADLALFVFSEQHLANTLLVPHQRGAKIRLLIDVGFAFRDYSEGLDLAGVSRPNAKSCAIEAGNRPWRPPIADFGFPTLPKGDLLHHKFAVLDGKTVIAGSHNWSKAAARVNDETLIVIEDSAIAQQFQREFDRLMSTAKLGIPKNVKDKIKRLHQQCRRR